MQGSSDLPKNGTRTFERAPSASSNKPPQRYACTDLGQRTAVALVLPGLLVILARRDRDLQIVQDFSLEENMYVRRTTTGPLKSGSTRHPSPHVSSGTSPGMTCVGDSQIVSDAALIWRLGGKNPRAKSSTAPAYSDASWLVALELEARRTGTLPSWETVADTLSFLRDTALQSLVAPASMVAERRGYEEVRRDTSWSEVRLAGEVNPVTKVRSIWLSSILVVLQRLCGRSATL